MAYNESTVGGTGGSNFRVWINAIRVEKGNAAQNYERWRAEGGVKRVVHTSSRYWNLYNQATYNVQLGLNGVTKSGNFSYDFAAGSSGGGYAWGTGTTTVYRTSSGGGRNFTARMDINMANSPYLTSGWVTKGERVDTVNRYGDIDSISPSPSTVITDETSSMSINWHKYAGRATIWFRLDQINNSDTTYRYTNVSQDPLIWSGFQSWVQQTMVNTNETTLYIYYGDDLDSNGSIDRWDTANTRTMRIANENGQANPTFTDFDYIDTDATAVSITGNNQALIQGKSNLQVTIDETDAATTNKQANRSNYSFTIGGYSSSETWPASGDVVKDIGIVSDVTGTQDLSVRAIDSRGNSTTVTKQVEVLPYEDPGFFAALEVSYVNDFDREDGLDVNLANDVTIGAISPLTLGGVDKNEVTPTTGLRFDMAYGDNPYTGTWENIAFTQQAGTGLVNVTKATLEAQILAKMNAIGSSLSLGDDEYNTERWYVLFELEDKYGPQYYTAVIDVGRPFFRIGADGRLYYKEIEFFDTFSGRAHLHYPSLMASASVGTLSSYGVNGFQGGWNAVWNPSSALGDSCQIDVYVPAGVYNFVFWFVTDTDGGILDIDINNQVVLAQGLDTYSASFGGLVHNSFTELGTNVSVLDGTTYTITIEVVGQNASSSGFSYGFVGVLAVRVGNL